MAYLRPVFDTEAERVHSDLESLKALLTWYINSAWTEALAADYQSERASLIRDAENGLLTLPDFVMRCATLEEFEAFIAAEVGTHPPDRVRHLRAAFKPLIDGFVAERGRRYREWHGPR